ncbi:MAG: transcriptional regulator, MerR family [Herbinix sp.]|jgi:DNA-binding transcriptional MerR regulator|nr:transcriptional regulator, MerR family [Herbinix sp.]
MLIKIGEVTNKFGISHRSLYYWESVGILKSNRGENDYRYYDEDNIKKIKQIVILRKLRLSIPSIQEIFTSNELSKVIAVFADHLDETKKETEQLNALGTILRQLLNMLNDRNDMNSIYQYLDTTHNTESDELKAAFKAVLSEPIKEIAVEIPSEPIVDITEIDLLLEHMTKEDIGTVTDVIKKCYINTKEIEKLFFYCNFENQLNMPDCSHYYKIVQNGECIGAINLTHVGMEAMLIRCLAYGDPDNNIYLFELLKQKHPNILCWNIYFPNNADNKEDFCYDWEGKKRQFAEDNGFSFYTDARWHRYIKMLKPHDEVYNSSRYRFALLDGSMDGVSFRFFGVDQLDFYDGKMTNWRINDCDFSGAIIYDTWLGNSKIYDSSLDNSDFRYANFTGSTFYGGNLKNCQINQCDIQGLTIDGINVKEALEFYKKRSN